MEKQLYNQQDTSIDQSIIHEQYNLNFKVILLGDSGSGKTSLIYRLIKGRFKEVMEPTIGIEYQTKIFTTKNNNKIRLEIWDTAGQERFRHLAPIYYRKASAVVFVFDITNQNSFDASRYWLEQVKDNGNPHCYKLLVGSKQDLNELKVNSDEEIRDYCKINNIKYIETSSKTGHNVADAFQFLVKQLAKRVTSQSSVLNNTNQNSVLKENQKQKFSNAVNCNC